jgi:hypothetical protein
MLGATIDCRKNIINLAYPATFCPDALIRSITFSAATGEIMRLDVAQYARLVR